MHTTQGKESLYTFSWFMSGSNSSPHGFVSFSCLSHSHTRLPGPVNAWPFGFVWTVRAWRQQNIWWIKSKELFETHGSTIGFRVFSSYSILTQDPECVRAIVTGSADLFPKGHLYKHLGLLPGGIFTTNGPRWRRDRRLLTPHFNFSAVSTFVPSFNAHVEEFLNALRQRCLTTRGTQDKSNDDRFKTEASQEKAPGVVLDMVQAFNRLTLDIIFDAGFGHDLHAVRQVPCRAAPLSDTALPCASAAAYKTSLDEITGDPSEKVEPLLHESGDKESDEIAEALRIAFTEVAQRLTDPLPVLKYLPRRYYRAKKATQVFRRVIDKAVMERRKRGEEQANEKEPGVGDRQGHLLDLMIAVHEEGTWCTDEMLAQSMTFLIAGHETTSAMLTWTLMELGERPDLWLKLRAEVDRVCGVSAPSSPRPSPSPRSSSRIDASHVDRMPFLRCVLKESLRMHPPVTIISRRILKDLEVAGYLIPKGWHVGVSIYTLHRSPALWERPDEFWPERWEEGPGARGKDTVRRCSVGDGMAHLDQKHFDNGTVPSLPHVPVSGGKQGGVTLPSFDGNQAPPTQDQRISEIAEESREEAATNPATGTSRGPLKSPFQYMPFSLGPRNCIGQRFAMTEASIILARLVRDWDVTLVDRAATVQRVELLTVRPDRLLCKLQPRQVYPLSPVRCGARESAAACSP